MTGCALSHEPPPAAGYVLLDHYVDALPGTGETMFFHALFSNEVLEEEVWAPCGERRAGSCVLATACDGIAPDRRYSAGTIDLLGDRGELTFSPVFDGFYSSNELGDWVRPVADSGDRVVIRAAGGDVDAFEAAIVRPEPPVVASWNLEQEIQDIWSNDPGVLRSGSDLRLRLADPIAADEWHVLLTSHGAHAVSCSFPRTRMEGEIPWELLANPNRDEEARPRYDWSLRVYTSNADQLAVGSTQVSIVASSGLRHIGIILAE